MLLAPAPAMAQVWSDGVDAATCALPVRYSFQALDNALRWNDIALPPEAVLAAHAKYADAVDALVAQSVPYAMPLVQGSNMSNGVRITDAELTRLRAHQKRLRGATDAAEEQLFDALAAVPGAEAPMLQRLAALRARRALDRRIEGIQRRLAIVGAPAEVAGDAGSIMNSSVSWRALTAEQRALISEAIDAEREARLRAWTGAEAAIDASIGASVAAQRDAPDYSRMGGGYMAPHVVQPEARTRAALRGAELSAMRAVIAAAPAGAAMAYRSRMRGSLLADRGPSPLRAALPAIAFDNSTNVSSIVQMLLRMPQFDDAARARIRPILARWIKEDSALEDQEANGFTQALTAAGAATGWVEEQEDHGARVALALTQLAELSKQLGVDWLRAGANIPVQRADLIAASPEDVRDFGLPAAPPPEDKDLPKRSVASGWGAFTSQLGMVPIPWQPGEWQELLDRLNLSPSQRLVAQQLLADADSAWKASVEPTAAELRALVASRPNNPESHAESLANARKTVAAQPKRRDAWRAAREVDAQLSSGLRSALGETAAEGRALLDVTEFIRLRDSAVKGVFHLGMAQSTSSVPDVIRAALDMRSSAEERAQLLIAISAQIAGSQDAEAALWEEAIAVQEAGEAFQLFYEERIHSQEGTAREGAAMEEFQTMGSALSAKVEKRMTHIRSANADLLARASAALPTALADRWRRAVRIYSSAPSLSYVVDDRLDLLFTLARIRPDAKPAAEAAFEEALAPWEAWAEGVIDEIDRRADPAAATISLKWDGAPRKRIAMIEMAVRASLTDRMNQAMYRIANSLPAEDARRIPRLRGFRGDPTP